LNIVNIMKAKKIFSKTMLALLTGFTIVSCNETEEKLEVLTDVYVINKKFDNEIKSATAYYAYANQNMLSVTVTIPNNGGNVELESSTGSIYNMAKEPKDSDFKTTAPVEGSYAFSIKGLNGETLQVPDILNYENLAIPQFTKIKFSGTPLILELEWNVITKADGYFVKMFDLDGKLVFNGYNVKPDATKYIITSSSSSGYWSQAAVNGKSYLLQINAFTNDSEANTSNYIYNISEISLSETQIKWGVND
jgi:hypothetical protein